MADGATRPAWKRAPWSPIEDASLREVYPAGGMKAARGAFPHRTESSIAKRVVILKLRSPFANPANRAAAPVDPRVDAAIREHYGQPYQRGALKNLVRATGLPHHWLYRRAAMLGAIVPRGKAPNWSPAELEILETCAGLTPRGIQHALKSAGYKRSLAAVALKRNKVGLSALEERELAGIYRAGGLAPRLGVQPDTVRRWCRLGKLKARKLKGDDDWHVNDKAVREFLAENPNTIDLRKVDREWFMHMAFSHLI